MATIYLIPTGGNTGNNALILDPRERLVYPFNIPTYNELRWGMIYSFTSVTGGNNSVISDDSSTIFGPSTKMYWGISNATTGTLMLPTQSGSFDYWGLIPVSNPGFANNNGYTSFLNYGGGQNFSRYATSDATGALSIGNNSPNQIYTVNTLSGSGMLFGIQFILNPNSTYSGTFFNSVTTPYIDTSVANLRNLIANRGTNVSSFDTGFWTSGKSLGGQTMGTPNAIFIYNPMLNSKMRIHSLVVEKYA